jgi:hypothetical protein
MSVGYAIIATIQHERLKMLLTHTLNVNVEFDKDNTPDYVINALVTYSEKEIQKLLSEVLINSLNEIKALEKINENNSYAKVSWGDN